MFVIEEGEKMKKYSHILPNTSVQLGRSLSRYKAHQQQVGVPPKAGEHHNTGSVTPCAHN